MITGKLKDLNRYIGINKIWISQLHIFKKKNGVMPQWVKHRLLDSMFY